MQSIKSPSEFDRRTAVRSHLVCRRIKAAVLETEPGAEVILFGSRARETAREDSDWDVLVLLDGEVGSSRRSRVCDAVYDAVTLPSYEHIVGVIVRASGPWHQRQHLPGLPRVVAAQGISL